MPDDPSYNFGGVLDEIKIFDYALLPDSVFAESGQVPNSIEDPDLISGFGLDLYPNPARESLTLKFTGTKSALSLTHATFHVFNILGQEQLSGPLNNQLNQSINISS